MTIPTLERSGEQHMTKKDQNRHLVPFEGKFDIRRVWHKGAWHYSVVDLIEAATDSPSPKKFWAALKTRMLASEGFNEEAIVQLKLKSAVDGRFRLTDTATRQTCLRILQSVSSPRVEPIRLWLAEVGEERIEALEDPEAAIQRVRAAYRAKGYADEWIEARLRSDLIRNELTDEWRERGAREGYDFAVLTNTISKGTFGLSIQAHKTYKLLPTRTNLRDHMNPLELALCSLGEATAVTLHRDRDSQGFVALKQDANDAGKVGGQARALVEKTIGKPVVSSENYLAQSQSKKRQIRQPTQRASLGQPLQISMFDEASDAESGQ